MTTGRRVLVHVGAPKTGTSFVQDLLFQNRDALAAAGTLYPADRFDEHFLAALDLMDLQWGGLERQAVGAWDRLAERVRGWDGTVVISHEILATASRQQVRRALDSFGDAEVHVVLSARDLVRQIPAEWQENVKHRRAIPYAAFLDKITDPARKGALASWFWGVQEVPDILDRWGATLPPGHVHLVTVPKPGAPRHLLWERFAQVFGLDPGAYTVTEVRANPSLGAPETAFLRRVNKRVNHGVLANHHYREFVRELLAHQTLSLRNGASRLTLPPDVRDWAEELSEQWIAVLAERGYDVVGTLADLRPDPVPVDAPVFYDPDHPDEAQVHAVAMDAVVTLLGEAARLREAEDAMRAERDAAYAELDRARGLWFRAKRRLVRMAGDNQALGVALDAYRRVRGSSSRSA
ncbi:MAG: hypothetical protein ACXVXC_09445 [Nocardioidaceae bacterium]